jgi:branched-chain amino acid transport system substrate-binding protein
MHADPRPRPRATRHPLTLLALLAAGSLALGALACGKGGGDTVKIGLNAELTGEMPAVGASSKNAAQMFVDEVNARGGLDVGDKKMKLELVAVDNGAKADQAAAAAQRLISQDRVVAMVGPNASVAAIPAAEIAENMNTPMITPWSTNEKTTLDVASGQPKKNVFRACFIDTFQAKVLARFVKEKLAAQTAAVLYDVASEAPNGQAELFGKTFEALGGKVVAFETYTTGDRDFSAQLTKIKAANPQVLFLPAYYNDVPLIAQQARRLGITAQLVGSDAWSSPEIIKLGGADVEGSYFCNHYSNQIATDVAKKFIGDYKAKYGQEPDDVAALTYDAMGLLAQAITNAKSTERPAVRDALSKVQDYPGVTGTMRFTPGSGDPSKSAVILQIKDGKFTWVANAEP